MICDDVKSHSEIRTWSLLKDDRVTLVQENNNDSACDSIEQKTLQWVGLCNQGLESSLIFKSDFTLFIEADLSFPYDLIDELTSADLDITAPIVSLGASFYDSWGFRRLDGTRINSFVDAAYDTKPIELSSVGSCVLFRTEIFSSGVRFRGPYETGLLVGVCNDARELGYKVWALPSVAIVHPTSSWRDQMWHIKKVSFDCADRVFVVNADFMIAGAYAEFIAPALRHIFKVSVDTPIEPGSYRFDFEKNKKDKTIEIDVSDFTDPTCRFTFDV
jgi:hypothetical protein